MPASGTFRLQRLEAEPIWDSIFAAAGNLDLTRGRPILFDVGERRGARGRGRRGPDRRCQDQSPRAYMIRGFSTSREVMPNFLQAFDVDDGRASVPAAHANGHRAAGPVHDEQRRDREARPRSSPSACRKEVGGRPRQAAVDLGYRIDARPRRPSAKENERAT